MYARSFLTVSEGVSPRRRAGGAIGWVSSGARRVPSRSPGGAGGARSQPERVGRDGEDGGDADDRAREDDEDGSGGVGLPRAGRSRRRSTAPASGLFVVRGRGGGDAEQLLVDAPAPSSHASAVASRVATRAKDARDARRRHYRPRDGDDRRDATRIIVE